jgi:alpha-tubulin suppressor-like RCC1 family protein
MNAGVLRVPDLESAAGVCTELRAAVHIACKRIVDESSSGSLEQHRNAADLMPLENESPLHLLRFAELRQYDRHFEVKQMKIACGSEHTALVERGGFVATAGSDSLFQLGYRSSEVDSPNVSCSIPMPVQDSGWTVSAVSAGRAHTLFISHGAAFAFGCACHFSKQKVGLLLQDCIWLTHFDVQLIAVSTRMVRCAQPFSAILQPCKAASCHVSTATQLGVGDKRTRLEPCRIELPGRVTSISAGHFHSVATTDQGETFVWGSARNSKLGPHAGEKLKPALLTSTEHGFPCATSASAGGHFTCVTCSDGRLLITGFQNAVVRNATPMLARCVSARKPFVLYAAAGEAHAVVLLDDGSVVCFGCNAQGQCGTGMLSTWESVGVKACGALLHERGVQVDAGDVHSMCVTASRNTIIWGFCGEGDRLGNPSIIGRLKPAIVPSVRGQSAQAAAGRNHSAILTTDGLVRTFGWNSNGMLGIHTCSEQHEPRTVPRFQCKLPFSRHLPSMTTLTGQAQLQRRE